MQVIDPFSQQFKTEIGNPYADNPFAFGAQQAYQGAEDQRMREMEAFKSMLRGKEHQKRAAAGNQTALQNRFGAHRGAWDGTPDFAGDPFMFFPPSLDADKSGGIDFGEIDETSMASAEARMKQYALAHGGAMEHVQNLPQYKSDGTEALYNTNTLFGTKNDPNWVNPGMDDPNWVQGTIDQSRATDDPDFGGQGVDFDQWLKHPLHDPAQGSPYTDFNNDGVITRSEIAKHLGLKDVTAMQSSDEMQWPTQQVPDPHSFPDQVPDPNAPHGQMPRFMTPSGKSEITRAEIIQNLRQLDKYNQQDILSARDELGRLADSNARQQEVAAEGARRDRHLQETKDAGHYAQAGQDPSAAAAYNLALTNQLATTGKFNDQQLASTVTLANRLGLPSGSVLQDDALDSRNKHAGNITAMLGKAKQDDPMGKEFLRFDFDGDSTWDKGEKLTALKNADQLGFDRWRKTELSPEITDLKKVSVPTATGPWGNRNTERFKGDQAEEFRQAFFNEQDRDTVHSAAAQAQLTGLLVMDATKSAHLKQALKNTHLRSMMMNGDGSVTLTEQEIEAAVPSNIFGRILKMDDAVQKGILAQLDGIDDRIMGLHHNKYKMELGKAMEAREKINAIKVFFGFQPKASGRGAGAQGGAGGNNPGGSTVTPPANSGGAGANNP